MTLLQWHCPPHAQLPDISLWGRRGPLPGWWGSAGDLELLSESLWASYWLLIPQFHLQAGVTDCVLGSEFKPLARSKHSESPANLSAFREEFMYHYVENKAAFGLLRPEFRLRLNDQSEYWLWVTKRPLGPYTHTILPCAGTGEECGDGSITLSEATWT